MNLILFGSPGAGKGTQSTLLVERKGFKQISTGDLLRSSIKEKSALGLKAQSFMDQGNLVPDDLVIAIVEDKLRTIGKSPFILDGFPRTLAQAEQLDEMLKKNSLAIGKVIFLDVPRSDLVKRLTGRLVCKVCNSVFHSVSLPPKKAGVCDSCGGELYTRADDKEEVIVQRLENYEKQTAPLKGYYERVEKLLVMNGNKSSEEVYETLSGFLD